MKKKPIRCVECPKYKEKDRVGYCPDNKWYINPELAKRQAVCDDTPTGEVENVLVLTPLGQKALISKRGYEEGVKDPDAQFWKFAKCS